MQALLTQFQVIHALVIRETRTRFGRHRLGYVWALVEPVLFIALFAGMYALMDRRMPYDLPVVAFLVTGFIPYLAFQKTAQQAMQAINGNKGLLFYPHVRPLDLVAARTALEIATHVVVFALLMAGAAMVDGVPRIDNLLMATGGLLLGAGLGAALGMVLCGLSVFSNSVERLIGPMMRPLFWVSALFFSTNEIPSDARNVLLYNPVLHVVELTRSGWFPGYDVPQVSLLYPALWIFILFYFGLTLERVARRRLELS
ncbi:MAG: ABC transporter permease [Polyangiaceae bacterium]